MAAQTLNDYFKGYTPFTLPKIPTGPLTLPPIQRTPFLNNPNNTVFPATTPMMNIPRTLPNGGGTYTAPVPAQAKAPVAPAQAPLTTGPNINPAYLNPDGSLKAPGEVVNSFAQPQAPAGRAGIPDIPRYAGDQFTEGPQTKAQLETTAAGLNNARNDIATGTTDPYKAASQSGVAYSPQELKAIESAYAGVYDPAINSALAKLDTKMKQDAADIAAKQKRAETIFNTDENIRQWKATTGSKGGGGGNFTTTQTHKGAVAAGVDLATFDGFTPDVKSYFVNMPQGIDSTTNKKAPLSTLIHNMLQEVASGQTSAQDVTDEINGLPISQDVKDYYLAQIPAHEAIQSGGFGNWFSSLISAVNPFD